MTQLLLKRLTKNPGIPTFGVLFYGVLIPFALTLERPWRDNRRGISCIPAGVYTCKKITSPKFGVTFEVLNVPGRQEILLHKGNIQEDSHGCILIGEQFGALHNEPGILASEAGFEEFMKITALSDTFVLTIEDVK